MTGLPTVQVLLDDGTGAFPYDITTKTRVAYTVSRGRQDEQSSVTPGQLALILDNNDGRFTLGSTVISATSPIRVDQQIRVKVTANAVTRDRFTGRVQQWPVEWPSGSDLESLVQVVATDAQARAERWPLKTLPAEEILALSPHAYYTLGDPAGSSIGSDTSGNGRPPLTQIGTGTTGAAVVFGTVVGDITAPTFARGKYLFSPGSGAYTSTPAILAAFNTTYAVAADGFVVSTDDGEMVISVNNGVVKANALAVGSGSGYNDGQWHTVAIRVTGPFIADVIVDGVLTDPGLAYTVSSPPDVGLLVGGYNGGGVLAEAAFSGNIAHVAAWANAPTNAELISASKAILNRLAGESGTARIVRLAGYANLPVGTLDASLTDVSGSDTGGQSVAAALRDVGDAEMGLLFIDGSGNLTFHNRNRPVAKTAPDITITADVLDPGTLIPVDTQGVINYFEATAEGGSKATQLVRNVVSELGDGTATYPGHGRYPGSASYLVQTDAEALDRANWIVYTHAEPAPRAPALVIDLLALDAATQSSLLSAEPNTWIRVTGLPSQAPGGTTADLMVQGFSESLTKDSWSIAFNVVNKTTVYPTPWILGDATYSVLDSTTRLYV